MFCFELLEELAQGLASSHIRIFQALADAFAGVGGGSDVEHLLPCSPTVCFRFAFLLCHELENTLSNENPHVSQKTRDMGHPPLHAASLFSC
jgi:hypothetical protein